MNFEEWKKEYGLVELKSTMQTPEVDDYFNKPINVFMVSVKFKNGYEEEFKFYDSVANYEKGIKTENLDEYALYCHLSDGHFLTSEFILSYDEYSASFGSENREKDQKTFEELKRLEEKALKYFGEDLLISMLNDLQGIYEF